MKILDVVLLLSIGSFVLAFVGTSVIDFLRKKKNKKKIKEKGENVNASDSN